MYVDHLIFIFRVIFQVVKKGVCIHRKVIILFIVHATAPIPHIYFVQEIRTASVKKLNKYDECPFGVAVINGRPGAAGEMAAKYKFHEILRNEIER